MDSIAPELQRQFLEATLWLARRGGSISRAPLSGQREHVFVTLPWGHATQFVIDRDVFGDFEEEFVLAVDEIRDNVATRQDGTRERGAVE